MPELRPATPAEGTLCLDFVNTLADRPVARMESLGSFGDLVAWAESAGVIDGREARELNRSATAHPRLAEAVLTRALDLREALYRILAAPPDPPAPADVAVLNGVLRDALAHRQLAGSDSLQWTWTDEPVTSQAILWRVAWSAAALVTSPDRDRVGECRSATCSWLFVDRSRGRRRQWCEMRTCGNREKARRHYARQKAGRIGQG